MVFQYSKFFTLLLVFSFYTSGAHGLTLEESFSSALGIYQSDKINDSKYQQAIEATNQASSLYFPVLSAKGSYLKQDEALTQKAVGLNLTANLFNGGKDSDKLGNFKADEVIIKNTKKLDQLGIYTEVVEAYFNFLLNLSEVKNLDLLKKQSNERVLEIKKRVQIGRSRRGELLQAEAQLASVEAQLINGEGLYKQALEKLILLTGLSETKIKEATLENLLDIKPFDEYLQLALSREDVENKQLEIEKFNRTLTIAKNHLMPKIDLSSNYYAYKDGSSTYKNADWDVGVNLTVPLYEGGSSRSQVKIEVEKKLTSQYQLIDLKRKLTVELSSRFEAFKRYRDQITPFDQALDRARKSYEETLRDYRLGLVTNLDVLTALNLYLDRKRDSEKTQILAVLSKKQIEVAAGILP